MIWFKKKPAEPEKERRRHDRLMAEDDFLIEFRRKGIEKIRMGQGKNLSLGGLCFATSALLRKGDELEISLYFPKAFPGEKKIETKAKVRWVQSLGAMHRLRAACQFASSPNTAEAGLSVYLDWAKTQSLTQEA